MKDPAWLERPPAESWNTLFSVGSNHRSLFRVTENTSEVIFPALHGDAGITADSSDFVRYQIALADTLSDAVGVDVQEDGFGGPSAVIASFQSLRNRAGAYMDPASVPMVSNRSLAEPEQLNLASGFLSERDERIFTALHHYMFRTIERAPMAIRKSASSGMPYFTSSLVEKKKALMVFNSNAQDILARFGQKDLKGLYDDYGLFFSSYIGVRTQPDSVRMDKGVAKAKPREVNDELYARTAGRSGNRFNADKSVYTRDGGTIDGIFAMRRRSVYAYPAMYNYFITQFFAPLRQYYLHDAEYCFKHRSPETIVEKLNGYETIRGYDVKQFDQSVQPWLIDAFVDKFSGFIKEEVLFFLRSVLRQPFYQPHPGVGAKFAFNPCFGDPFDLDSFTMEVGLPSGIGCNPDMGKFFMTFAYLCIFDRHFNDVLETGVQKILRGQHDRYSLLDMCDDAVLATNDPSLWQTVDRVLGEQFYFRVEPEDGVSFLGNVLYKDERNILRASPNVVTFLRNRLCPEHGVQHWSRNKFAGTGWFEGKKHYSSAPRFGEVWALWDDVHRKFFKEGLDTRFFQMAQEERHRGVPSLEDADRAVLENPDKLYYRYSIEEIHPWVLDQLIGAVQFEEYFPSIERFFI